MRSTIYKTIKMSIYTEGVWYMIIHKQGIEIEFYSTVVGINSSIKEMF